jgi:hypothetical protein
MADDAEVTTQTGPLRLTYNELADRLGVSPEAARIRARRRGWPVGIGNDGKAVVTVWPSDLDDVSSRTTTVRPPNDHPTVSGQEGGQVSGQIVELSTLLEAQERVIQAEGRAAAAEAIVTELRAALEHERVLGAEARAELRELRRPWWTRWLSGRTTG